ARRLAARVARTLARSAGRSITKPRRVAFVIGWRYGCRVSLYAGKPGSATVELTHGKELL
ncbi:hypothetical protein, partial [Burkholderia ambifaria]|uniref:hypothetical protein n=1 Tax=Burkholderia ambifaria TaxID=152480 RepID=UPI001E4527D9